jgi:hypothetical protein
MKNHDSLPHALILCADERMARLLENELTLLGVQGRTVTSLPTAAEELCLVMAEVYLMDSASRIRIGGEELDGHLVREVFGELSHEHVDLVMRNFKEVTATVKNKKAYLRASLYQSVFELESHYINRVSHDLGSQ